jgi:hypothetical protein
VISLGSGVIAGFLGSRFFSPDQMFDDKEHFHEVEFGNDIDKYNETHENIKK